MGRGCEPGGSREPPIGRPRGARAPLGRRSLARCPRGAPRWCGAPSPPGRVRRGRRDAAAAVAGSRSGRTGAVMSVGSYRHVQGNGARARAAGGGGREGEALVQQAPVPERPRRGRWRHWGPRAGRALVAVVGALGGQLHEPRPQDAVHALAPQLRGRRPGPRRPPQLLPARAGLRAYAAAAVPAAARLARAARLRFGAGARRGGAPQPRQHVLHERHAAVPQQHRALRRVPGPGPVPGGPAGAGARAGAAGGSRPARPGRGHRAAGAPGAGALDAGVHPAAQPGLQGEPRGPGSSGASWAPPLRAGRISALDAQRVLEDNPDDKGMRSSHHSRIQFGLLLAPRIQAPGPVIRLGDGCCQEQDPAFMETAVFGAGIGGRAFSRVRIRLLLS